MSEHPLVTVRPPEAPLVSEHCIIEIRQRGNGTWRIHTYQRIRGVETEHMEKGDYSGFGAARSEALRDAASYAIEFGSPAHIIVHKTRSSK